MAKSILQKDKECFLCTRMQDLEQHHIFGGPNPEMVREIWSESLAVPAMPPGSEAGGSF